jgi:hypothetical protein
VKRLYQTQRQKLRRRQIQKKYRRRQERWAVKKGKSRENIKAEGYSKKERQQLHKTLQDSQNALFIKVPERFSFIHHPEEFLKFLHELGGHFKRGHKVKIDFRATTFITGDAFTVLLSKLYDKRFCPHLEKVWLLQPNKTSLVRVIWDNSGMAKQLSIQPKVLNSIEQLGNIINVSSKEAIAERTSEMVELAMEKLFGKPQYCLAVQTIFVELMDNTTAHAAPPEAKQREMWWTSVYYDKERQTLCYSFVDNGLGILETAQTKQGFSWSDGSFYGDYTLFGKEFGTERSKILQDIFARKTRKNPSRTGDSYRGHGLNRIYKRSQSNDVSNLTVVTNDVHAKLAENEFRMMNTSFHGTFFYWEYSDGNRSN